MHMHESVSPGQWEEQLRAAGLRVTQGRNATLGYLAMHPHSSAADIFDALGQQLPSLSLQSVHNIANDLSEHGILRRVDLPDSGSALYELHSSDNHHHVQCVHCHRIEDVACAVGEAPCMLPHNSGSMRILEASVTYRGICATCEATKSAAPENPPNNTHKPHPVSNR
jgi:Fe2+ or Zn2+ uptake regulation protein